MGSYRLRRAAHRLITGLVMVMVLVTTFWSGWSTPTQAAPASDAPQSVANAASVLGPPSAAESQRASLSPNVELAPMDALVVGTPGQNDALVQAILSAGGYVYVQQGSALFAGLNGLTLAQLTPVGAQAVYQDVVSAGDLAGLSAEARDAAEIWNGIAGDRSSHTVPVTADDVRTELLIPNTSPSPSRTTASDVPTADETSVFMAGNIAVKVLFIESNGTGENWTEIEINKVKTELVQAFDWWSNVATQPRTPGEPPRPSANLVWNLSYVSPFEGDLLDRPKVQVSVEPITQTISNAIFDDPANLTDGWLLKVAAAFTGGVASEANVRTLANTSRGTNDWSFVIFVVDSSSDTNGKFADELAAAGALNGPYALVTSRGGDLGTDNLEILIAKMVGHVFGAGEEGYNFTTGKCRSDEMYGYFQVLNENCDSNPSASPSLMRSGSNMVDGYYSNALSEEARQMVGWKDSDEDTDGDDLYDILDTLEDTFTSYSSDPGCPILHLGNIDIINQTALPEEPGPGPNYEWTARVWDTSTSSWKFQPVFHPVNINQPSAVWGRINGGEWLAGDPSDGSFNSQDENYSFHANNRLIGVPGMANQLEIAILNRWGQDGHTAEDPVTVSILSPANLPFPTTTYQSTNEDLVNYFNAAGTYDGGWTESLNAAYSGGSTLMSNGINSEVCFAFEGTEVTLLYNRPVATKVEVQVDGDIHSYINVTTPGGGAPLAHLITNLPSELHIVQLKVISGVAAFDGFRRTDNSVFAPDVYVIDAGTGGDIPVEDIGFWEEDQPKINYLGSWSSTPLFAPDRPDFPNNNNVGRTTTQAYDRFYAYFTNADTVAIYRGVFPGGGTASVYVDGELRGTMYNDAAVARVVPFYISGLVPDFTHIVEVSINPGTPHFDLDALRFLNLLDDPALPEVDIQGVPKVIGYKGAQEISGLWEDKTTYRQTKETGALQTFYFRGSAIGVNIGTSGTTGLLEMVVDGRFIRTINTKTAGSKNEAIVAHGFDPDLPHVVQIRQINEIPLKPKYAQVYGFTIFEGEPVGPGEYEEYEYDVLGKPIESVFLYEQNWGTPKLVTKEPGPSGDHFIETAHEQARAYLYFTGADSLTLYATAGGYGAADLYVNGLFKGTFVQKGATTYNIPFTLTGFDSGANNVLEIRVNTALKMTKKITIDRVLLFNRPLLFPGSYENDTELPADSGNLALQFSGQWTNVANVAASGGSYHMMKARTDEVIFDVTDAAAIKIYRRLYSKYGLVDVYVDNQYHSSFDNYVSSPTTGTFQQPYMISGLDPGFNHRIRLVAKPIGTKLDQFKPFDIDRIEVLATSPTRMDYLEAGRYDPPDLETIKAITDGAISYVGAGWVHGTEVSTASIKGSKAQVVFFGNAFRVYFNRVVGGGKADIYIDGKLYGTYNTGLSPAAVDVPYTLVDLEDKIHTAQIVAQGAKVNIKAYEVWSLTPYAVGDYDLAPVYNPYVLRSGLWTIVGDSLTTKEAGAKLFFYLHGGNTLTLNYDTPDNSGNIEIYVNGVLHSYIDSAYIKSLTGTDADYIISSLGNPLEDGAWIEIRNPKASTIGVRSVSLGTMGSPLGPGETLQAEGGLKVQTAGWWVKKPGSTDVRYKGGFYYETKNRYAHFYIPVQNVSYVTLYRPLVGGYNDASVYIDGTLWGTMPMVSSKTQYSAAFSIGPIPNPSSPHVIELRSSAKKNFAIDQIEGYGLETIGPGYYENDHVAFIGGDDIPSGKTYDPAYSGTWKVVTDALASNGTLHQANSRGARLVATVEGNEITIFRRTSTSGKVMIAYVDGTPYQINNYSKVTTRRVPHTILLPNAGPHSFELVVDAGNLDLDAI
ncbi:MAG: hypothetical protein HY866_03905, partial [Chloroflexi bacterium]|nr:hypothetical protein [Chloroflexota bacterium]